MRVRMTTALGLMLALLAGPLAGAVCETRCGVGDTPPDTSAASAPGSCHREAPVDEGARLAAGHTCVQPAALPAVPALKTDAGRGLVKLAAAAAAASPSLIIAPSAALSPPADDAASPPVPAAAQHLPLRI